MKKGLNCMLEKKKGVNRVDKLRAILLMEADFNFVNKLIFGSRMLRHAEQYQNLPDENAGSRNGRSYVEVALKRRLVGDRLRLTNRAGCIISADAHTCYDRIVHKFVILVCMSLGVPYAPLKMMFSAIVGMEYMVRTSYGDSTETVSGGHNNPFQGVCQGNGAGPAIWLVVSLMLVLFMHKAGKVSCFRSSISGAVTALMGFMFVDDTDLLILGAKDESLTEVLTRAQEVLDTWGRALRLSGGALAPDKCYYTCINYGCERGIWTPSVNMDDIGSIQVTNEEGKTAVIQAIAHGEAIKTVGAEQALTGTEATS